MLALIFEADKLLVPESDSKSVRVTCCFCHSKLLLNLPFLSATP